MQVEVLLFGGAALAAKAESVTVNVTAAPTVREVLSALHAQHPALRFALPAPDTGRLAVNRTFATGEHPIKPGPRDRGGDRGAGGGGDGGDEVALVTLVGGG